MKKKSTACFLFLVVRRLSKILSFSLLYVGWLLFIFSCANRVNPSGGEKDVKPPEVKHSIPPDQAVNMANGKIEITFDEFVQLKDLQQQLVISPLIEPSPEITVRLKTVTISLPDSLLPNTTYTLNFGTAIADIHEGNALENFQYVFSTGNVIDSLICKGRALSMPNGRPEKGIVVMLYRAFDDSLPYKKKPDYFAKTNDQGDFVIRNISAGKYTIVALNDKNKNYKCDNAQEEAISLPQTMNIPDTSLIRVNYFNEEPGSLYIKSSNRVSSIRWNVIMNKSSENLDVVPLTIGQPDFKHEFSSHNDSLIIWCNDSLRDSLSLKLMATGIAIDTLTLQPKQSAVKRGKGEFSNALYIESHNTVKGMFPGQSLQLKLNNPIKAVNNKNIIVLEDTIPVAFKTISFADSLKRNLRLEYPWKEGVKYTIRFLPGAFTDFSNRKNDSLAIIFAARASTEFGTLEVNLSNVLNQHMLLQLTTKTHDVVVEYPVTEQKKFTFNLVEPGVYLLRLIVDENRNNKWDTGNYFKKQSPEKIYNFKGELQVRANWELELEWNIGDN